MSIRSTGLTRSARASVRIVDGYGSTCPRSILEIWTWLTFERSASSRWVSAARSRSRRSRVSRTTLQFYHEMMFRAYQEDSPNSALAPVVDTARSSGMVGAPACGRTMGDSEPSLRVRSNYGGFVTICARRPGRAGRRVGRRPGPGRGCTWLASGLRSALAARVRNSQGIPAMT